MKLKISPKGVTDHNNLSGLQGDDHPQYVLLIGRSSDITVVNVAAYDLLVTDVVLHVTYISTGAVTVTLPTAQATNGRQIDVKDAVGNADVNNVTISTEGAETIDGQSTFVISTKYESASLYSYDGNWFVK